MAISVKEAKGSDWQDLRFVRLRALQTDPSVFASNFRKESAMTEADWKNWLQSDDMAIFLVYQNATVIGMSGIAVDRDDASKKRAILWGSWLEPFARGRGLSHVMYRKRIEWAAKHPTIEHVIVSHRASNLSSRRANQKHGFQFTHSTERVWPDGSTEEELFYALNVKRAARRGAVAPRLRSG